MRSRRKVQERKPHIVYVVLAVLPLLCLWAYTFSVDNGLFNPHRGKVYEIEFEVWSVRKWERQDHPPTWQIGSKGTGVFNLRGNVTLEGLTKGAVWWVKYETSYRDLVYTPDWTPIYTVIEMERIR